MPQHSFIYLNHSHVNPSISNQNSSMNVNINFCSRKQTFLWIQQYHTPCISSFLYIFHVNSSIICEKSGINHQYTLCFSLNMFLRVQQGHCHAFHHIITCCPALQLWPALFQVCSFLLLNVLELGPLFSPVFIPFPSIDFLTSWCKNPRLFTWGFILLFGPKVTRTGGEGFWFIPHSFQQL